MFLGDSSACSPAYLTATTMAGPIRQPINLDNLSKYIDQNAPEIKTPIDVKQVRSARSLGQYVLWIPNANTLL